MAAPLLTGDGEPRVLDPADRALADYDPQVMPQTLEDHTRAVLERSVPDLGPVTFRAGDGQGAELPPEQYDKASGMSVTYGNGEHSWSVDLSHAKSEAEGDAEEFCAEGLADGYFLECTVDTTSRGYVVISRLEALEQVARDEHGPMWGVVRGSRLDRVDPDKLWFEHRVKVIKSQSLVTYVSERVHAPTVDAAEAAFRTPVVDLVEIGTDPELVIPEPPTDDSGCGPWTLDPGAPTAADP